MRVRTYMALGLACAALAACGSGSGPDSSNKLPDAVSCIKQDKGIPARQDGKTTVQIGNPTTGPRIRFFLTSGEAEAAQFEGREEGSEQIGAALLYVRQADDQTLAKVEKCLDDL